MIRFLKNIWLFRKELKRWRNDDWVFTEELLHKALAELNNNLKPNNPELETVVAILDKRAGWFYEMKKLNEFHQPKFTFKDGEWKDGLTTEQRLHNEKIIDEIIGYKDSDFKFMFEQISLNADKWFL